MKKIFTLLFAVSIVGIASAQSPNFDHGKKDNGYSLNDRHSTAQAFNRGYETNRSVSPWEREKQMRYTEQQGRFEKRRHEHEYKRFTENNHHKW